MAPRVHQAAKSIAAVQVKVRHLEFIPTDWREWRVNTAIALAHPPSRERDQGLLFRMLATLRTDIKPFDDVDQPRWSGPTPVLIWSGRDSTQRSAKPSDLPAQLGDEEPQSRILFLSPPASYLQAVPIH